MSEQPKKRGLFQLHLSTCVVLMLVAGGLLWANLSPHKSFHTGAVISGNGPKTTVEVVTSIEAGFPDLFYLEQRSAGFRDWPKNSFHFSGRGQGGFHTTPLTPDEVSLLKGFPSTGAERKSWVAPTDWSGKITWSALLANTVHGVFVLGIVAFLCEWLLRRERKP